MESHTKEYWDHGFFFYCTITRQKCCAVNAVYLRHSRTTDALRQCKLFQHGGAPRHYTTTVRNYVNKIFNGKVIGRQGSIKMPPRSSDLTPKDFFFWGVVKDKAYITKPATLEDLIAEI